MRWHILLSFLVISIPQLVIAQTSVLQFESTPLADVFKQIERKSDLTFNYDQTLVEPYQFTGKLAIGSNNYLDKLLASTPLSFEILNKNVLVFLAEKQEYSICGYLMDATSSYPLGYANIFTADGLQGTQSALDGRFECKITARKNELITLSYLGYQKKKVPIQTFAGDNCPTFLLNMDPLVFGTEIIVKDYILDGIEEGDHYNAVDISFQRIANNYVNIEQDLLKTIQYLPEISSSDESATNIQIRGGSADQNLIRWEGVSLYEPGHFFGMISAINPFVVENVKVYKGVFDPSYDDRVGGVVDISLNDSIATTFKAGLGTTLTEAHAFIDLPIQPKKLSLLLSGRRSLTPLFGTPTMESYTNRVFQGTKVVETEDELSPEQALRFYDWNGKLNWQLAKNARLKLSYFKSQNDFNFTTQLFEEDWLTTDDVIFGTEAISTSLDLALSPKWSSKIFGSFSNYKNDYNYLIEEEEEDSTGAQIFLNNVFNQIRDLSLGLTNHWAWTPNISLQLGYTFNQKLVDFNIDYRSIFEGQHQDLNNQIGSFHNLYSSLQYQNQKWQLDFGLRGTYYQEVQQIALSPRFNAQLALNKKLKLKFSAGLLQQYITQLREFGENDLEINSPVWVISRTETNNSQEAQKLALGALYQGKGWLFDIEAYHHFTRGLSTYSSAFRRQDNIEEFASGDSRASGIDLLVTKHWKNYKLWFNYSFSDATYLFPAIEEEPFAATNNQPHKLSVMNSFTHGQWTLSLNYQYRSGLPFSAPEDLEAYYDEEDEEFYYELLYPSLNADKLPDYQRLDLSLSRKFSISGNNGKGEVALSFLNVLDSENLFQRDHYIFVDEELEDPEPQLGVFDRLLLGQSMQCLFRVYW